MFFDHASASKMGCQLADAVVSLQTRFMQGKQRIKNQAWGPTTAYVNSSSRMGLFSKKQGSLKLHNLHNKKGCNNV